MSAPFQDARARRHRARWLVPCLAFAGSAARTGAVGKEQKIPLPDGSGENNQLVSFAAIRGGLPEDAVMNLLDREIDSRFSQPGAQEALLGESVAHVATDVVMTAEEKGRNEEDATIASTALSALGLLWKVRIPLCLHSS